MTLTASIDIETLSTRVTAKVLSVGICFFDDEKLQSFDEIVDNGIELFFDREVQDGRHESSSTLEWWGEQGEAARRCLVPDSVITPREFHGVFQGFCDRQCLNYNWIQKYCRWYARGPHFDIAIMDSLFTDHNVSSPWKYWQVRDIRTWLEAHGIPDNLKMVKPHNMIAHNALHDAAFDAYQMQQLLHKPFDEIDLVEKVRKGEKSTEGTEGLAAAG